ncbi:MAG: helix-turn-helix transcriptional regulator [Adlercreutzia sp.]|nr:helix-turn-helix transcriptional regulator [Adlercreutzia sp.]
MNKLSNGRFAAALLGLVFSWVFFPPVLMAGFFPDTRAYAYANETILLFCFVLFGMAVLLRRFLERLAQRRRGALAAASALLSLAGYGLLLFGLAAGYSTPLALAATLLLAAGYVALMVCWMVLLGSLDSAQTTLLLFGSAMGYAALTLGNFLPDEGRMVLCGGSVALSGICWLFAFAPAKDAPNATAKPGKAPSYDFAALGHGPYFMLGLLAVLLIGGRVTTGLYFNLDKELSMAEMLIRCLSIACVMAYCIIEARRGATLEQEYRSAWVPAAALFLLGAMLLIGMSGPVAYAGLGITHGAINCFEVLAYLILFQFVKNDRVSPVMVLSLGMIVFKVLPISLQRLAFPQIIASLGLTEADVVPVVILMSMTVLACALAFGSHRASAAEMRALAQVDESEAPDVPNKPAPHPSFEEACLHLAEEGSLSTRETEIMLLIARGNSQKHIAEVLYLALGTVQWYAKTIYRKLGVHSKQELINLVNQYRDGN